MNISLMRESSHHILSTTRIETYECVNYDYRYNIMPRVWTYNDPVLLKNIIIAYIKSGIES